MATSASASSLKEATDRVAPFLATYSFLESKKSYDASPSVARKLKLRLATLPHLLNGYVDNLAIFLQLHISNTENQAKFSIIFLVIREFLENI